MKILVLQGSPNKNGSTSLICDEFTHGAQEAGHETLRIDVALEEIHPCKGCIACGYGTRPCVQKDSMEEIYSALLDADMVVFATPLYYFGMTAQLKSVIDRFCARNTAINGRSLKCALLTVAWDSDSETFKALESHYNTLCHYLNMQDCGRVLGYGCGTPNMTRSSRAMVQAYELGLSL